MSYQKKYVYNGELDKDVLHLIGVNHPAIVWEIPHYDVFLAFPHFSENVPHFWLYFEKQIFLIIGIILGARKKLCALW